MAEQNINTNITATANFSGLTAQLQAVTSELIKLQTTTIGLNKNLSNQIGVMNKSFAETLRSTGQFATHFVTLTSDVEKFGKNLDSGRMKLSQYFNTWQGHAKKTSSLVKDLAKQQVLMEQAILQPLGRNAQGLMQYNVHVAQGLDTIKNKTALARQEAAIMNKVMQDGANQLINWGKNTQWAGRQLTVGLTVPMAAFGAAAAKAFREADAELVRLTKVYGGLTAVSREELAKVRKDVSDTAKELASAYGSSYKETISLAADLAATGKQGKDLIQATEQTTRLAVLGEVDRQDAMKATLAIQNAFKQNTEELTQSIDFLNAVENQTSTSLADLVEAIPKAGPVIKSLGGDVKDLALYLTAMKEGGVNASEGANAIKSAMASLINPTKVAKEMFQGMGINLSGIVEKNAGNLTATILDLQSALDSLDPLSKSRAIEQLFGKFQYARMSALFENLGKSGSQTLQVIDLMKASTTDLANISARELSQMTESASGKYKRALESVKADLAQVGESFLKINTFVLNAIDGVIKFMDKLPGPVKNLLTLMGGLTALAGPLIMLTGVLGNFFGYVIKGVFHLKNLFRGGEGFKLLTPEIMAASKAGTLLENSFYSDAKASATLKDAVLTLAQSFDVLKDKALASSVAVTKTFSTMQGNPTIQTAASRAVDSERMADKNHPLVGKPYSRQMAHLIPAATEQPGTIFGVVPNPGPVNVRIGKNPQMYASGDMPKINGLTAINGVSTGIVAEEAAKWHAMTAAIATQSEAEIALLKREIAATGTITSSLSDAYQAMLPQMKDLTALAAKESGLIVNELKAGKLTVDQARAQIIQLNAVIETMMAETAAATAAGMGRNINLTTVPLTGQPVVGPGGKSNMKEMFHKGPTANIVNEIARNLGVRTSGAGFSIETTVPKNMRRFNSGGYVPGTGNTDTYETTLPAGSFVVNKRASEKNADVLNSMGTRIRFSQGGGVPVILTPGEFVADPKTASENLPELQAINNGGGVSGGRMESGGQTKTINKTYLDGLYKYIKRSQNPNYDQEIRLRHILHDTAGMIELGVTPDDASRWATDLYDEPFNPKNKIFDETKGDFINREEFMRFKAKQLRKLHKQVKEKYGRSLLLGKEYQVGGPKEAYLKQALSLFEKDPKYAEHVKNGVFTNISQSIQDGAASEHNFSRKLYRMLGPLAHKNIGHAFLGDQSVNQFTARMGRVRTMMSEAMSLNKFEDRAFFTSKAGQKAAADVAKKLGYDNPANLLKAEKAVRKGLMSKELRGILSTVIKANPRLNRVRLARAGGGPIGNVTKSTAMKKIGADFGPDGNGGWAARSLTIGMGRKLFGSSGLTPRAQNLMYDRLVQALEKEMPYGYTKNAQGQLIKAIEPSTVDSMLKMAASSVLSSGDKRLSAIDRKILREQYANWNSTKWTPSTVKVRKQMFGANMGGQVPQGYALGGQVGKLLGSGILSSLGFMGGNAIGAGVGGDMGGMIGGMLMAQLLGGIPYMSKNRPAPSMSKPQWQDPAHGPMGIQGIGQTPSLNPSTFTKPLPGMEKLSTKLASLGTNGGKFAGMLGRAGGLLSRLPLLANPAGLAIAGVTAAVFAGIKIWKDHNEHLRIGMTQYSLTAEAAAKAGLKFTDYNAKMKSTIEDATALREANKLIYESLMSSNQPIEMTIEEYKKLRKEVKTTYTDQIKLINQTNGKTNLQNVAVDLKNQLISAGMSADDATKKIYAMFKVSNKGSEAMLATLNNSAFTKITDAQSAAVSSVKNYSRISKEGGREGAGAVQTAMTALDTAAEEAIAKSRKAAAKDKTGNTKVLTQLEAELQVTNKINDAKIKGGKITEATLKELEKTNPSIRKFANTQDTVVSLWQKIRLQAKGYNGDLSALNATQTNALLTMANAISAGVEAANKEGLLKSQYKALDDMTAQQKKLIAAQKGQSVQQQINSREALAALQKQIDLNNKLAESRLKALDLAKQEGDLARELEKKKAEYEANVATGNTAAAQQNVLDIKGIQSTMQYNSQKSAIENARDAANKPLQKQVDAINAANQKQSDAAALAGESLGKLNDRIDAQRKKINGVNDAMTAFQLNADKAGLSLEEYAKTTDGAREATRIEAKARAAGIKTTAGEGATKPTVTYVPGVGPVTTPGSKGKSAVDSALDLMTDPKNGLTSAIAKALSEKGITMQNGDIYINNKKLDMKGVDKPTTKTKDGTSFGAEKSSYTKADGTLKEAGRRAITDRQSKQFEDAVGGQYYLFDYDGKSYAIEKTGAQLIHSFSNNKVGKVVKAGYGTNRVNPRVPTIVGDRGPEMLFGNMVIPNMAKVPYASPRYDVNKASLQMSGAAPQSGPAINYTQHIHASDGMNVDELVSKASREAMKFLQTTMKSNDKMVGMSKNVRINRS